MAFTRVGLGAELRVNEQPMVRGMARARDSMGRFVQGANRVGPATGKAAQKGAKDFNRLGKAISKAQQKLDKFSQGMRNLALAAAPAALAMYKGVKTAATFEQAMADLGAVSRASETDMGRLSQKAKEMGIVTAFSASESANAMEQLARAGATVDEQIGGIRGVLDLAAAGNVEYAQAAEITANITRAMGREFKDTSNLADILALAASRSNTTVQTLGEAFRYGAPQAHTMGIRTEELTAIFGKLGDAGLKGSISGTSLTNMLVRLSKPSKEAQSIMKEYGVVLTDDSGKLRNMAEIVEDFRKKLETETNAVERARKMTELFGIRGQKAYAALATAGGDNLRKLQTELERASDGLGTATTMAQRRLDTLMGAFKMLGASIEGLSIEVFTGIGEGMKGFVQEATSGLNNVLHSLSMIKAAGDDQIAQQKAIEAATKKYGETAATVAAGIMDAIKFMKDAWNSIVETVKGFGRMLQAVIGKSGVRALVALGGKIMMVATVMVPVALGLAGISFIISRVLIPATLAFGRILRRVFSKWGVVLFVAAKLVMKVMDKVNDKSRGVRRLSEYESGRAADSMKTSWLRTSAVHGAEMARMESRLSSVGSKSSATFQSMSRDVNQTVSAAQTGSQNMKAAMVGSLGEQEKQAIEMGKSVSSTYGEIVSSAENAAGATEKAWTSAATNTKETWAEAAADMKMESSGLISVLGDVFDLVAEGATMTYEALGGVTERTKYNAWLAKRSAQINKERAAVEAKYGAEAKKHGFRTGSAYLTHLKMVAYQKEKARIEEKKVAEEKAEINKKFDKWEEEQVKKREKYLAAFAKLSKSEQIRVMRLQAEGKLGEFELKLTNRVCIDGKDVSWAVARQQQEITQRAGAKTTPYQRSQSIQGALPGSMKVETGG